MSQNSAYIVQNSGVINGRGIFANAGAQNPPTIETVLLQNLLAVIREDVKRQRGGRRRCGAGFQQGQSIFRADGELTRKFDNRPSGASLLNALAFIVVLLVRVIAPLYNCEDCEGVEPSVV